MKRMTILISVLLVFVLCLCGCTQKCTDCSAEIENEAGIEIENTVYCNDCIEHCEGCNKPLPKSDSSMKIFESKKYCQECFDEKAYPIILNETDKYCMSIVNYDDETGLFAINIKNKTQFEISSYDADGSTRVDGSKKCIGETDGMHSFAYIDVPANEDITVFSSFRVDIDENWNTVYKMSDNHTFEFMMNVAQHENTDEFWDDSFKVILTPEMFGY